ncbi:MAG: hypothetical protein BJ554DRAFT_7359 [Olpidium bornovanus]|uniref:Uncharacterized protein n=1 Tax=Olpidium bornovanus TaxID=278681 RepID=A0A8H8A1S6_9FUNG|nr:MAG: hypothetical protein BJ554DRAFT_7359 [Olpidium bornovanus]
MFENATLLKQGAEAVSGAALPAPISLALPFLFIFPPRTPADPALISAATRSPLVSARVRCAVPRKAGRHKAPLREGVPPPRAGQEAHQQEGCPGARFTLLFPTAPSRQLEGTSESRELREHRRLCFCRGRPTASARPP